MTMHWLDDEDFEEPRVTPGQVAAMIGMSLFAWVLLCLLVSQVAGAYAVAASALTAVDSLQLEAERAYRAAGGCDRDFITCHFEEEVGTR
jgi:hypothetical protein